MLRGRVQPALCLGNEPLEPGRDETRLAAEVLAHRTDLALEAAAVLAHGPLDAGSTVAKLALDPRAGLADLPLEPVACGCAAALVALELALDAGTRAVLRSQALHARGRRASGSGW